MIIRPYRGVFPKLKRDLRPEEVEKLAVTWRNYLDYKAEYF